MYRLALLVFLPIFLISGCIGLQNGKLSKELSQNPHLNDHFVGLAIYDPVAKEYLFELNSDRYFTPASNTKLFTYYAGLKLLGDSLAGLKYIVKGDSLIFRGTGDPTFLNPDFKDQIVYDFLKTSEHQLFWNPGYYEEPLFGPGWSWDDYDYGFQPERTEFPIYGNTIQIWKDSISEEIHVLPALFKDFIDIDTVLKQSITRDLLYNVYSVNPSEWSGEQDTIQRPFKYSTELLATLLSDTLRKPVKLLTDTAVDFTNTIFSYAVDPVYARVLLASDNFVAEQLLLNSSINLSDNLKAVNSIAHMRQKYLQGMSREPIWVDGSGLSRYNLFTPKNMVELLVLIAEEVPREKLYRLMPAGGVSGTLRDWYSGDSPYVFAKTGTLSNNHCLSGYLETGSGKQLIFSFMNNNYGGSAASVKVEMQKVLELIRDRY